MMPIKVKRVYDAVEKENDGTRILIMRLWPRGIGREKNKIDEWKKVLSPCRDTLNSWNNSKKTEQDWKLYLSKFQPQMKGKEESHEIQKLHVRSGNGEVITLLCGYKHETHCHRYVIKSMIDEQPK